MDLNEVAVYVRVVEAGSFAKAAADLGMPKSTVSAKVSALERRLGVTLIRRTTRRLFVTDAGRAYFDECVQALRRISSAEEQVAQGQEVARGLLRLTAPVELGATLLPKIIDDFQKRFPEVSLEVSLSDERVDLVADGFDLAIRAGELKDSTLVARKLGTVYFAPFAAAKYLKAAGTPKSPKELVKHRCIHFAPLGARQWTLARGRETQTVDVSRQLAVNDLNLIKQLALSGAGIALLPTFFCHFEERDEKLVRVLAEWRSNVRPVHFVYPSQEFVPKKLKAFLELATEPIRDRLALSI